jgi:hypothetical protein
LNESIQALIGLVGVMVIMAIIAWPILKIRKIMEKSLLTKLAVLASNVGAVPEKQEGFVQITSPVYLGIIIGATEYETGWWIPKDTLSNVSKEISILSFKYGLLTIFFPYVLLMVVINYISHLFK